MIWLLLVILAILVLLEMPIAFALPTSAFLYLLIADTVPIMLVAQRIASGLESYVLLAIPLFIFAGNLFNSAGIASRIFDFAIALVGHIRGSLGHVNVVASVIFSGMSGIAQADAAGLGAVEVREMKRYGFSAEFSAAITAVSSIIGPIIPPSGIMIIYSYVMGESVAALFLAGVVPGVLVGLGLMLITWIMANRHDFPVATKKSSWFERGNASLKAFFPLLTPVIILGGILGGIFTPTEASAVAVAYSLIVSLLILKSMKIKDLPKVLTEAAMTSSVVLLLVGAAMAFKTVVSLSHTPEIMAEWILSLSSNPLILLFLINLLLFLVGMFLDAGPAIIILAPILGPIFLDLGVHPVHFAIIMSVNLTVGLATPPMGLVLFVASSVSGERIESISRSILPFLAVEVIVIFMITYIPAVSLAVPRFFGFISGG